jgi:hypothetical protein
MALHWKMRQWYSVVRVARFGELDLSDVKETPRLLQTKLHPAHSAYD